METVDWWLIPPDFANATGCRYADFLVAAVRKALCDTESIVREVRGRLLY